MKTMKTLFGIARRIALLCHPIQQLKLQSNIGNHLQWSMVYPVCFRMGTLIVGVLLPALLSAWHAKSSRMGPFKVTSGVGNNTTSTMGIIRL